MNIHSRQAEDKAILRVFKKEIAAARWMRGEDKKIYGLVISFEDGAEVQMKVQDKPMLVSLIEPVRRDT